MNNEKYNDNTPEDESMANGLTEISENQAWDDFLEWCRKQENGPHE